MAKNSNIYVWSLGHSNFPIETFLNKLKENKIQIVIDCRSIPTSRFCPHFNKKALGEALATETIKYIWKGKNIGFKRANVFYEETIDELSELAKKGKRICLVCAEKDYTKCHRYTVLTPSFEKRGLLVIHIQYEKRDSKNK